MADPSEEFEPLFDYSRVQPFTVIPLDDDLSNSSPERPAKKQKKTVINVEDIKEKEEIKNGTEVINCEEEEEDWLASPPKISNATNKFREDSTIKELRQRKQELASYVKSAAEVLCAVEESLKRDLSTSLQSSLDDVELQPAKPLHERAKVVISIQEKNGLKQFRIYADEKFERLFKMYADKAKLDLQSLVFSFDGEKISATATPEALGMEDEDIIEVHVKSG